MKIGDPSDKLDAQADGNFGGKHNTNRRAGYSKTVTINGEEITELEWLIRRAKKDATLASGEGRKIVEHYERILAALREPSEAVMVGAFSAGAVWDVVTHTRKTIQLAVAAAEKEVSAAHGLAAQVLDAVQSGARSSTLPPIREAMDALMTEASDDPR